MLEVEHSGFPGDTCVCRAFSASRVHGSLPGAVPQAVTFRAFTAETRVFTHLPQSGGLERLRVLAYSTAYPFTRENVAIQFASQFLPPSFENACSSRNEFAVMSEKMKRTKMARPFNDS